MSTSTTASKNAPGIITALAIVAVLGANMYFSIYTFHALSYRCQADCTATKPVGKTIAAFTGTGDNNLFYGRDIVRYAALVSAVVSVIAALIVIVMVAFAKKA